MLIYGRLCSTKYSSEILSFGNTTEQKIHFHCKMKNPSLLQMIKYRWIKIIEAKKISFKEHIKEEDV